MPAGNLDGAWPYVVGDFAGEDAAVATIFMVVHANTGSSPADALEHEQLLAVRLQCVDHGALVDKGGERGRKGLGIDLCAVCIERRTGHFCAIRC